MPVVKFDDIEKDGRKARRLLFICFSCRHAGSVAVRRDLYSQVCQKCGSGDWITVQEPVGVIQRPPKKRDDS